MSNSFKHQSSNHRTTSRSGTIRWLLIVIVAASVFLPLMLTGCSTLPPSPTIVEVPKVMLVEVPVPVKANITIPERADLEVATLTPRSTPEETHTAVSLTLARLLLRVRQLECLLVPFAVNPELYATNCDLIVKAKVISPSPKEPAVIVMPPLPNDKSL